jgi:E3 ubiquitin-protein ligase synoviolin
MSVGSYRIFRTAESVVNILELSVSLFFIGCLLIESELPIFHVRQLIDNANGFYNQHRRFHGWMKKRYIIGHLPIASESDMERDDMCVICRLEMHIGSGLKLPCNHCFHRECIERWIGRQLRCPTCRHDVKSLLDEAERLLNWETDSRPVGGGDEAIIRFADLVQ